MIFPLVGNTKIKQSVLNFIKEKRLPHAILIEGDAGTGRHSLASFLATAAVCESENSPCGECKNCHLSLTRNHPDIITIAPEENKKNIAVKQIRELKSDTHVKPHISKRKVFFIDYADTLNESSQNALLKVLEEPPGDIMFILIAESKASLLETIISRCVCLTLSAPERNIALEYLTEKTDFGREDIRMALEESGNNIGRAILKLSGKEKSKTAKAAKEFMKFMLERNLWGMLQSCKAAEKSRVDAARFIKELQIETATLLKENLNSFNAVALSKFHYELCEKEKCLISNINLSLLFCSVASKAAEIMTNR